MNFFDGFARFVDETVFNYMTLEILLVGTLFFILSVFLILILVHLFSKDFSACESLKYINRRLMINAYGPETEKMIFRKFKTMPYRFYENRCNLDSLKFYECAPHYESSKNTGNIFFAVFSLAVCFISLALGLILNSSGLIYLSDAILIFTFGIIFSLILYGVYVYLKQKTRKKLEWKFNEFLKLIKIKKEAYKTTEKFSHNIKNIEQKETVKSENFLELLERIKEVKLKNPGTDKIKDLINDIANARDKVTDLTEKECLTEALTDLLSMINAA